MLQGLRDLNRDPNLKVNSKLVEWLDENGVWVKTQSAWGKAPHPLGSYSLSTTSQTHKIIN